MKPLVMTVNDCVRALKQYVPISKHRLLRSLYKHDNFDIKQSTQGGRGNRGVFAKHDMKKETLVGMYLGVPLAKDEIDLLNNNNTAADYTMTLTDRPIWMSEVTWDAFKFRHNSGDRVIIDASAYGNYTAIINHSNTPNVCVEEDGLMYLLRDIHAGQELFFKYNVDNENRFNRGTEHPFVLKKNAEFDDDDFVANITLNFEREIKKLNSALHRLKKQGFR